MKFFLKDTIIQYTHDTAKKMSVNEKENYKSEQEKIRVRKRARKRKRAKKRE